MLELQVSPARLPQPQAGRSHAGATGEPCPPPTAAGWSQSCWSYRWARSLSQSCWSYRWALPASHSRRLVAVMLELQVSPARLPQPQAGRSHAGATGEPCPPPTAAGWSQSCWSYRWARSLSQSCWSYRWALPASHSHRLVAVMLELQVSPACLPQPQAGRSDAGATGEPWVCRSHARATGGYCWLATAAGLSAFWYLVLFFCFLFSLLFLLFHLLFLVFLVSSLW